MAVLCLGIGRRWAATATQWYKQSPRKKTSPFGPISTTASLNGDGKESKPVAEEEEMTDEELLASMDHLMKSFPVTRRFRALVGAALGVEAVIILYSLAKLLSVFNHQPPGARWALILCTFFIGCVQWPAIGSVLRYYDTVARKGSASATPITPQPVGAKESKDMYAPLLDGDVEADEPASPVPTKALSPAEARAAKRQKQKLEDARKKAKEARARRVEVRKARVNMTRLLKLSTPDAGLLLLGFVSLAIAALCSALIPRFTGAVVDRVVSKTDRSAFGRSIGYLLLAGVGQAVFGALRGGILTVTIARLKVSVLLPPHTHSA